MFLPGLAWRDVKGLWRRYAGLSLLIAIAVAAVGGGLLVTTGAETALRDNIAESVAQRTITVTSNVDGQPTRLLDVPLVEQIRGVRGVEEVEPSYSMGAALLLEGGRPLGVALVPLREHFPPPLVKELGPDTFPLAADEVVVPRTVEGVALDELLGEVVDVERSIALRPGEARAQVQQMKVVALSDPAWQDDGPVTVYLNADTAWRWYDEASPGTAEEAIAEQGFRQATALVSSAGQVDEVLRTVQATGVQATAVQQLTPRLPDGLVLVRTFTRIGFVVLTLLAITSSAFLVRGLVFQRTREVGLLKALGYRNRAVWSLLAMETVIVAWIGALIGLVVATVGANVGRGVLPASAIPRATSGLLFPDLGLAASTLAVTAAVVLVGSAFPLLRAFRLDASRALRDWQ